MHQRPTAFTDFYFILLLLFFNLAPFWRDVATDETYGTDHKKQFLLACHSKRVSLQYRLKQLSAFWLLSVL